MARTGKTSVPVHSTAKAKKCEPAQFGWDEEHPDTSEIMKFTPDAKKPRIEKTSPALEDELIVGELIIFPFPLARGHKSPFGIGKLIEIRPDGKLYFQWFGNSYNGTFARGWL